MMRTLDSLNGREANSFGVVRLFAAVAVIVSHAFILVHHGDFADPLAAVTSYTLGAHAVHMFFVLSGFLIAASWYRNPDIFYFLSGRFLRLFPALFVVTLSTILIAGLAQKELSLTAFLTSSETVSLFLRVVLALDGGGTLPGIFVEYPQESQVLATVWTIRYEVLCYLSVPLIATLAIVVGRSHRWLAQGFICLVLIACMGIMIARSGSNVPVTLIDHLARFFFAFYLGVGAWFLRRRISLSFVAVAAFFAATYLFLGTPISPVLEIIAVGYFTYWLGSLDFGWFGRLTNREDISYGVYLIGFPIQQMWLVLWPAPYPVAANIALSLLVVVPLAFLSWRIVEHPVLKYRLDVAEFARRIFTRWSPAAGSKAEAAVPGE